MSDDKMTYGIIPLYKTFIMQVAVGPDVIESLNTYLDSLQKSKERKSHAYTLVGQIRRGKGSQQLLMNENHTDCMKFKNICLTAAYEYMRKFYEMTIRKPNTERVPQIDEMWSVHSYEGDYNTIHTHGCKTLMGISMVLWTKVPEQISKLSNAGDLRNASGAHDGFLGFLVGDGDVHDTERLRFSGYTPIKPEVGKLYVFPSWTQHVVWPFFGEGERRTVAANVNMFRLEQLSPEDQARYKEHKQKFGQGAWGQ
tara:strand:+ start:3932 stop:4693 length:762 start_codon:yes stop_codon:yes gene_type:complete